LIGENEVESSNRVHRVLIAGGHLFFRRGLAAMLSSQSDFQIVGDVATAAEALAQARRSNPDLLIADLALMDGDGQRTTLLIRQEHPSMAVLFLTQEDKPQQLEQAIAGGAHGYMAKTTKPAQLLAGIRQIAAGHTSSTGPLSGTVPALRALAASNERYPPMATLTSRELEVMRLLAEGRTVRDVASELSLSMKTIEAHKLNLMRKLDIHNRAALIEYAMQKGLLGTPVTS
jgi:two-component system, NarL family, response regulator NreC